MNADELLRDLAQALTDADGIADPLGVLLAWAKVASGQVKPTATYALAGTPTARERAALAIAVQEGHVTAGQLAERCGVHPETARLTLANMVEKGALRAEGHNRGRRYRL